jgi:hypothetical protein
MRFGFVLLAVAGLSVAAEIPAGTGTERRSEFFHGLELPPEGQSP